MKEIWITMKEFDGMYLISNSGKVYSKYTNKIKKLSLNAKGYSIASFGNKKQRITKTIHRFVAKYFIPNPNNYPQVNHIDGIKTNNNVDNLEWCDNSMNAKHAYKMGLNRLPIGIKNGNNVLTEIQVLEIKQLKGEMLGIDVAKLYHVSNSCIYDIWKNRRWKQLTESKK